YEQCGWKGKDFLFGTLLFNTRGSSSRAVTNEEVSSRTKLGLGPVGGGDARHWVSITNQLFPHDHYCAWFNIGCSFGSIFMPWHSRSEGGTIVSNVTPESGKGKSHIAKACAGIWGHWNALTIKDYDTPASQGLILAVLCNIPGFVDELAHFAKNAQFGALHLVEFIEKFAAGHDKHRALPHGMGIRIQLGTWAMILITTSNQPIIDLLDVHRGNTLTGNALGMRVFELNAMPPRMFDTKLGDDLEPHIWLNAGHAGYGFLEYVMRPDIQTAARKMVSGTAEQMWALTKLGSEHRFRIRAISCAIPALMIARDKGLVPRDLPIQEIADWARTQLTGHAAPVLSGHPTFDLATDALSRFFHANVLNTLRVQHAYKAHTTQLAIGQKPQKLVIRHESMSQKVYATQKDFRSFVVEHGFPYTAVVNELRRTGIMLNDKRMLTLGAGTEYASVQVPCVEFNGARPIFGSILQEVPHDKTGNHSAL